MQFIQSLLIKLLGTAGAFKLLFNLSPMYRSTGGRIVKVSEDLKYVKIKLKLNYKTRNYVGTIYGGSMYSCVDGIYMVQLLNILSSEYVVWDKSASIRFRKPGNQTLFAEFQITDDFLNTVKSEIAELNEKDYLLKVDLKDKEGKVYAEIEKLIYIASKNFYKEKRRAKVEGGV